jgi:hypothetical protein
MCYTQLVTELDRQILQLMKSSSPPQTVAELVMACAPAKSATIFSKLSALLNSGELTRDELPWRRDQATRTQAGRPKKDRQQRALEKKLEEWIDEGDKDRVAAAKTLIDLRMTGTEVSGPPPPNDKDGTIAALCQQLAAVGRDWATEAYQRMWPTEAVNGETGTMGAAPAS